MVPVILCIDDEVLIRKMLVEELSDAGYKTLEAANGVEGLSVIKTHKPDLILCDLRMPSMDGNELLMKLRDDHSEFDSIPFIFLTNKAERRDIVEGRLLGADDYLTKPVDFNLLRATIESRLIVSTRLEKNKESELDDLRQSILGVLPHELRTPLNHILGFSAMMKDETFGPIENDQYRDYVNHIHEGGEQLLKIINNVLYLTDALSGKLIQDRKYFSASDCIGNCAEGMSAHAKDKGIELSTHFPDDLPELYTCEDTLENIISALLSNAVKYTPAGGKVEVCLGIGKDSTFVIKVKDNGIGIAEEDILKVLKAFGRVENSMTRTTEGPGIGLTLAKGLTELLGGTFNLQSEINNGTVAKLSFPLSRRSATSLSQGTHGNA